MMETATLVMGVASLLMGIVANIYISIVKRRLK